MMTASIRDSKTDPVHSATAWLATEKNPPHPIIPVMRREFGLSPKQAIEAIAEANLIRARSL